MTEVYVAPRTNPGERQGNWAVRTSGEIISNHRKKSAAKRKGRKEAKKRDTTLTIQKENGEIQEVRNYD